MVLYVLTMGLFTDRKNKLKKIIKSISLVLHNVITKLQLWTFFFIATVQWNSKELVAFFQCTLLVSKKKTYITTPFPHHDMTPKTIINDPREKFQNVGSGGYWYLKAKYQFACSSNRIRSISFHQCGSIRCTISCGTRSISDTFMTMWSKVGLCGLYIFDNRKKSLLFGWCNPKIDLEGVYVVFTILTNYYQ